MIKHCVGINRDP